MMSRERIIQMLKLDARFVRELIVDNGGVSAIEILRECFSGTPRTPRIPDPTMSLMIWNILTSIDELQSVTKSDYTCIESIQHLAQMSEPRDPKRAIANHIVCGIHTLEQYVTR